MDPNANRTIAEWLGYSVYHYDKDYRENCYYQLLDSGHTPVVYTPTYRTGERKTEAEAWGDVPDFANGEAWYQVEEALEARRLQARYLLRLFDVLGLDNTPGRALGARELWALIRATPEEKCQAALRTIAVEVQP